MITVDMKGIAKIINNEFGNAESIEIDINGINIGYFQSGNIAKIRYDSKSNKIILRDTSTDSTRFSSNLENIAYEIEKKYTGKPNQPEGVVHIK